MSDQPTVYVIDDHLQERESVAALVSPLGYRCKGFATADQFFSATEKTRPGCLVLDYRLDKESGLEALKTLNKQVNPIPTLVVTAHADIPTTVQFLRLGAMTLLEKPYQKDEFLSNVKLAVQRDTLSLDLHKRLAKIQLQLQSLSKRQHQIIDLVLQGYMNKRIAIILEVSQRTVENERATILSLFEVKNAVELATKITEYRSLSPAARPPVIPLNTTDNNLTDTAR